jgi:hypothetical protein
MRYAVGHDDVAAKVSRVTSGNEDAAIMRNAARERAFINFHRGPVVITTLIFAIERIEAAEKMDRAGGRIGAQFDEACGRGGRGGRVDRSPSIRPAATGKNERE